MAVDHGLGSAGGGEVPEGDHSGALVVRAHRMAADDGVGDAAAAGLPDRAELVDREVVGDVVPAPPVDVEGLDRPQDAGHVTRGVVVGRVRVVHDGHADGGGDARRVDRRPGVPRRPHVDGGLATGRCDRGAGLGAVPLDDAGGVAHDLGGGVGGIGRDADLVAVGVADPDRLAEPGPARHLRGVGGLRAVGVGGVVAVGGQRLPVAPTGGGVHPELDGFVRRGVQLHRDETEVGHPRGRGVQPALVRAGVRGRPQGTGAVGRGLRCGLGSGSRGGRDERERLLVEAGGRFDGEARGRDEDQGAEQRDERGGQDRAATAPWRRDGRGSGLGLTGRASDWQRGSGAVMAFPSARGTGNRSPAPGKTIPATVDGRSGRRRHHPVGQGTNLLRPWLPSPNPTSSRASTSSIRPSTGTSAATSSRPTAVSGSRRVGR